MPTAAIGTAAAMALAALDEREVRDLMLSVGNVVAVGAFVGGLVFFFWAHNRRPKRR